jgi:hypothetical protein
MPTPNNRPCHHWVWRSWPLRSRKMASHSHSSLVPGFAGSILHQLLVTAPPATSTAAHIRLSGCGHAASQTLPVYRCQRGGLMGARGRWESCCLLVLIDLVCKKISSCELGYCRRGNSPFVLGLKPSASPPSWYGWDEVVEAGGG